MYRCVIFTIGIDTRGIYHGRFRETKSNARQSITPAIYLEVKEEAHYSYAAGTMRTDRKLTRNARTMRVLSIMEKLWRGQGARCSMVINKWSADMALRSIRVRRESCYEREGSGSGVMSTMQAAQKEKCGNSPFRGNKPLYYHCCSVPRYAMNDGAIDRRVVLR